MFVKGDKGSCMLDVAVDQKSVGSSNPTSMTYELLT